MPRGVAGRIPIRDEHGNEIDGQQVHAICTLPAADVARLKSHVKRQGRNYTEFLEQVLRDSLDPIIQTVRETEQEREAELQAKEARAEELRRLIAEQQDELRRLEQETRRL